MGSDDWICPASSPKHGNQVDLYSGLFGGYASLSIKSGMPLFGWFCCMSRWYILLKRWPSKWWQSSINFGLYSAATRSYSNPHNHRLFLNKVQAPLVLQTHTCRDHNSRCKLGSLDQQPTWRDVTFSASWPHSVILSADRWVDVKRLFVREEDLLACRHWQSTQQTFGVIDARSLEINALISRAIYANFRNTAQNLFL